MQVMKYYQINESTKLPDLTDMAPFKVVLAIEIICSEQLQNEIADWLVTSGCRYVMIWILKTNSNGDKTWLQDYLKNLLLAMLFVVRSFL